MNGLRRERTCDFVYGTACVLATFQFAWFYLCRVRSCLDLVAYEQGREKTPFQYRLLLMFPLRWAHGSPWLQVFAARLTAMPGWFPNGIRPEGLIEAVLDVLSVGIAGWMTSRLYRNSSRHALLGRFIYPFSLVMITWTYSILTMHSLRFVYDLPSLAFFAVGLVLIYERTHPVYFLILFVVATINRETTLVLLLFYGLAQCCYGGKFELQRLWALRTLLILLPLCTYWMVWHFYVVHRFAANASDSIPRFWMNVGILMWPQSWPQVAGACCYLWPFLFLLRDRLRDPLIRVWLWTVPAWFLFMMYYGILVEVRIFGELIPYVVVASALIFEETLVGRFRAISYAE